MFLIAGVFSAIYLSGGLFFDSRGVLCYNIRVVADSRGVLCYISEWQCFLIAWVFSVIYPSGGLF